MQNKIEKFIKKNNLIPKNSKIILGLSGGPDSVYLLHFLSNMRNNGEIKEIIAAHLDHEWRPESEKDTEFCSEIAKKYNVPFVHKKISNLGLDLKFEGSKEELGRNARRYFLKQVQKENKADLIALAHHAQDQQETFFIRLIRGSSLSGLTAMRPKHGDYIRPLLEINKTEIIDFLDKNKIAYLTDPSNMSEEFLRNRIRKHVIPALKQCDKRFDQNFKETLNKLQATEQFLSNLTQKKFQEISDKKDGIFYVNLKLLLNLDPVMLYRILIFWLVQQNVKFPISKSFLDEIIKFLKQPRGGQHQLYQNWSIVKKKDIAHIIVQYKS